MTTKKEMMSWVNTVEVNSYHNGKAQERGDNEVCRHYKTLAKRAVSELQKIADEYERMRWISLNEGLPKEQEEKIVIWDEEEEAENKPCQWWDDYFNNGRSFISHWRYVTQPPKDKR
jgi:hypothetical protein